MTPARKDALQWFHDRGEVWSWQTQPGLWTGHLTERLIALMTRDGQLGVEKTPMGKRLSLTDKGRRDLHEAEP